MVTRRVVDFFTSVASLSRILFGCFEAPGSGRAEWGIICVFWRVSCFLAVFAELILERREQVRDGGVALARKNLLVFYLLVETHEFLLLLAIFILTLSLPTYDRAISSKLWCRVKRLIMR